MIHDFVVRFSQEHDGSIKTRSKTRSNVGQTPKHLYFIEALEALQEKEIKLGTQNWHAGAPQEGGGSIICVPFFFFLTRKNLKDSKF